MEAAAERGKAPSGEPGCQPDFRRRSYPTPVVIVRSAKESSRVEEGVETGRERAAEEEEEEGEEGEWRRREEEWRRR